MNFQNDNDIYEVPYGEVSTFAQKIRREKKIIDGYEGIWHYSDGSVQPVGGLISNLELRSDHDKFLAELLEACEKPQEHWKTGYPDENPTLIIEISIS